MPRGAPLTVVGLGPGSSALLPPMAEAAIVRAKCVAGYGRYVDLISPELLQGKRVIVSGMGDERKRCQEAIEAALGGEETVMVCSGDGGIYAMASLLLELLEQENLTELPFSVIPGIPAFCAAAAALGAPIGHDFACVSLSDLLTPLELIFQRLEAALCADFVLVLYNPRSRGRPDYLDRAVALARTYRAPHCPVGVARNVSRPGESVTLTTLGQFDAQFVDMLSLVIIGNSQSRGWGRFMITPRGYSSSVEASFGQDSASTRHRG